MIRQDAHGATHCNTLQHTATHCNTLQHTATHSSSMLSSPALTATHCTTHCNTLQRTATHYNALQHTTLCVAGICTATRDYAPGFGGPWSHRVYVQATQVNSIFMFLYFYIFILFKHNGAHSLICSKKNLIWDMTHKVTTVMTHSCGRHDSFICDTWLIHMWDMTHSYVTQDSFICDSWLIHMRRMTHKVMSPTP